jgi:predicted hydrocarbon binding protein
MSGQESGDLGMAEVRGKIVSMCYSLLQTKPEAKVAASNAVKQLTGTAPEQLDPERWYDTMLLQAIFKSVEDHVPPLMAWAAIKVMGQRVFPTLKATVGLPEFASPLDFLKYAAESFRANVRGIDVRPRKILKAVDNEFVVEAPTPGFSCVLIEGVFDGVLKMCNIHNGTVKQIECVKNGDPTCIFQVKW